MAGTEVRLKDGYPDPARYPDAEAMVFVSIVYPGSGGEVVKIVKGERKEYRFRSVLKADALYAEIAAEFAEGYKSGKYKLTVEPKRAVLKVSGVVNVTATSDQGVVILGDDELRGPVQIELGNTDARWLWAMLHDLKRAGRLGDDD